MGEDDIDAAMNRAKIQLDKVRNILQSTVLSEALNQETSYWATRTIRNGKYVIRQGNTRIEYNCTKQKYHMVNDRTLFGIRMRYTPVFLETSQWEPVAQFKINQNRWRLFILLTAKKIKRKEITKEQGKAIVKLSLIHI